MRIEERAKNRAKRTASGGKTQLRRQSSERNGKKEDPASSGLVEAPASSSSVLKLASKGSPSWRTENPRETLERMKVKVLVDQSALDGSSHRSYIF